MGLLFCCPSCGANLRVTADVAPLVSCPGCGEPIRVPQRPHPVETNPADSALPPVALTSARTGLYRLLLSLGLSTVALGVAVSAFGVRLVVGKPMLDAYPVWFPITVVTLASMWGTVALIACACRRVGYTRCRPLAAELGVEAWARASAVGSLLVGIGAVAVIPWLVGRPVLHLSPELIAFVLAGLTCGLVGLGVEFAFLTVLHRLLWETSGWQVANGTSRYTMHFVFAVVAGMGGVCLGTMAAVMVGGDRAHPAVPWIGAAVLAGVVGCTLWTMWGYMRLLLTALDALDQPEPQPPKVTHRAE